MSSKVSVMLGSSQRDKARFIVSRHVMNHLRSSDNDFAVEHMIVDLLEKLPIEDLYYRDYLIMTGEALAEEKRLEEQS